MINSPNRSTLLLLLVLPSVIMFLITVQLPGRDNDNPTSKFHTKDFQNKNIESYQYHYIDVSSIDRSLGQVGRRWAVAEAKLVPLNNGGQRIRNESATRTRESKATSSLARSAWFHKLPKCLSASASAPQHSLLSAALQHQYDKDLGIWAAMVNSKLHFRISGPMRNARAHHQGVPLCFNKKQLEVLNSEGVPSVVTFLDIKDIANGEIKRMHFDDPYLLTVLPAQDRWWQFKTCAVVGNSGTLLTQHHGSDIDKHEAVFRINYAPTEGFERHVGSYTTFDVINQQHTKAFVPEMHGGGSLPQALRSAGRESTLVLFEIDNEFARGRLYSKLQQTSKTKDVVILNPELVRHAHGTWDILRGIILSKSPKSIHHLQAKKPMSGWFAVFFALQICESVTVYGMSSYTDPPPDDSGEADSLFRGSKQVQDDVFADVRTQLNSQRYHYFDLTPGVTKSHSFDLAYELYRHIGSSPCTGVNLSRV